MDIKTFLIAQFNVHESKHGDEFIYIGHDPAKQWSAFFKGEERDLGLVVSLDEAQDSAHYLFDSRKKCSFILEWKLMAHSEIKDMVK
ncbi:MAG TPA: hypothetical protein VK578_10280 [Edaphobacter sp.]|nr:hypothetical protein [Edaphobacter sp.]